MHHVTRSVVSGSFVCVASMSACLVVSVYSTARDISTGGISRRAEYLCPEGSDNGLLEAFLRSLHFLLCAVRA